MNKWMLFILCAVLCLTACSTNKTEQGPTKVEKASITTTVAILPLKSLDSASRYINKILTVRDLGLTFDKYANYVLKDMDETAKEFKSTGYIDADELEKEDLKDVSKNLNADVIVLGNISESHMDVYNLTLRFYSPRSDELKQISFNVGKNKTIRWKALDEYLMKELDLFVSNEMDKLFNIATNYYNSQNYTEAEKSLKQVVALKPDKVDAYYYLGNTYVKLNNNSLAEQNFIKVKDLAPQDTRGIRALIDLYDKTNQTSKRIALMEQLAATNNDEELWLAIGNLYDKQGDKDKAKDSFRKALAANSDYTTAAVRLGLMLFDEGNFSDAIQYLEQAFNAAPDNDLINRRLASAYQKSGRMNDAVAKYEGLITADPSNIGAYLNVIGLYRTMATEATDPKVAADNYTKAVNATLALKKIDPENAMVYLNLAAIYLAQNKYNEAETNANTTISKNPNLYQPYVILSVVYQTRGTEAYNSYIDLDRQASKAVGKKATQLKTQRDAAKANANTLFRKAQSNLNAAMGRATDQDAQTDISSRLSHIEQLISQTL
jgi:tetratricopeptide (TPR) repeat protein